jgi:hypothetical protein
MKRRGATRWAVAFAIVLACVGTVAYMLRNPVDIGSPTTRFAVLTADFGFRHTQLTRSFDLYLCSRSYLDLNLAECTTEVSGLPGAIDAGTRSARPEIVSTTVSGELQQVDNGSPIDDFGCKRVGHGSLFPSNQVKAVAENRGAADLVVSLVADSDVPEEVRPGTYCGVVTVARASGADIPLYVLASVGDRGQGALRARVFLALLLGAIAGAVVKWLGDRYAPVAGLRRRQRRLLRRFGAWRGYLPERAQYDLAVVDDGIGSFDPDGVDASLSELEKQGDALTRFSFAMEALDRVVTSQEEFASEDFEPPVSHVVAAEQANIARLRGERFPWAEADQIAADADELRNAASSILTALRAGDAASYQSCAELVVGSVERDQVQRLTDAHGTRTHFRPSAPPASPVAIAGASRRSVAQLLLDNSLLITMLVGAFVVAFVGFQSQFVGEKTFDAGNGDYLQLFAWAFAIQVAGVTILEVAGKLVTSSANTGTPERAGG